MTGGLSTKQGMEGQTAPEPCHARLHLALQSLVALRSLIATDDHAVSQMDSAVGDLRQRLVVGDDDERLPQFVAQVEEELVEFLLSRLPEGSSARITAGRLTKARATATRCFSPPESSLGLWRARSARPMKSSSSSARFRASEVDFPAINAGIITFSMAVNSGRS